MTFGSRLPEQMQGEEQFHQPQMFVRMSRAASWRFQFQDDMVKMEKEKAAKPQEKSKPAPDRDSL